MRRMKFLFHVLFIATFLIGSDFVANGGAETAKVIRGMELQALWNDVKVQHYQVAAGISQDAHTYQPDLAIARLD
jgi:hypothetical protein